MEYRDKTTRNLGRKSIVRSGSGGGESLMDYALGMSRAAKRRRFKVCQCPECGTIQVTEATEVLTCVKCGVTRSYKVRGAAQVKIIETDSAERATEVCKFWASCVADKIDSLKEVVDLFMKQTMRRLH